ncbi:hypothetical protein ACFVT9_28540 [Kitasatospora cineracea]|uniref:hypothetical protein n=1 Tax=Kitasatospora cineracea TaxID=88074 RepID=UPI0036DC033D
MSSAELTAAPSVPAVAGLQWLAEQTRSPAAAMAKWRDGRAVAVPVGTAFVVVQVVDDRLGRTVFHELRWQAPESLGPVIANQALGAIEFLAAVRPSVWMGAGVRILNGSRKSIRDVKCPPLERLTSGRRWLHLPHAAPGAELVLTNPLRLSGALGKARKQLAQAGHMVT